MAVEFQAASWPNPGDAALRMMANGLWRLHERKQLQRLTPNLLPQDRLPYREVDHLCTPAEAAAACGRPQPALNADTKAAAVPQSPDSQDSKAGSSISWENGAGRSSQRPAKAALVSKIGWGASSFIQVPTLAEQIAAEQKLDAAPAQSNAAKQQPQHPPAAGTKADELAVLSVCNQAPTRRCRREGRTPREQHKMVRRPSEGQRRLLLR